MPTSEQICCIDAPWKPESAFLTRVARAIGFTPLVFWGRWGVPLFIPRPKKITVVVGKPLRVDKIKQGGEEHLKERVEEVHAEWVKEMKGLWNEWRDELGYKGREVVVV